MPTDLSILTEKQFPPFATMATVGSTMLMVNTVLSILSVLVVAALVLGIALIVAKTDTEVDVAVRDWVSKVKSVLARMYVAPTFAPLNTIVVVSSESVVTAVVSAVFAWPFTSAPFTSAPFTSAPFTSATFTSAPFTSAPFTSAPFTSATFGVSARGAATVANVLAVSRSRCRSIGLEGWSVLIYCCSINSTHPRYTILNASMIKI